MKIPNILIIAFVLTLVSGLYISYSWWILDAEHFYFGFPFHWLVASRSTWFPNAPWHSTFRGDLFFADFLIYGLVATIAMSIYEKKLRHMEEPKMYRIFFSLSAVALVICSWVFIFWSSNLLRFFTSQFGSYFHFELESFLRFLLGVTTVIFTWFLIKYLKQVSTPLATSSD
jgi:FlaA1/EpsC-like NDP-sugar epimerase